MGIPKPVAIATLMEKVSQTPEPEIVNRIHEDFQARMKEYYRTSDEVREVPGAAEVFRTLRDNGIKVVLDTGFDRTIVDVLMTRLGWGEDLFDATVTSDEVERGRPYPDLIFRAMELTGVTDAKDVAKVGDTPSDLQEGAAAGCGWIIGVTSGTHSEEQLLSHPHTDLVESVRDLPSRLLAAATV
jgi:phosphonatase-like hydrolase